jgi:hypothetical protein
MVSRGLSKEVAWVLSDHFLVMLDRVEGSNTFSVREHVVTSGGFCGASEEMVGILFCGR